LRLRVRIEDCEEKAEKMDPTSILCSMHGKFSAVELTGGQRAIVEMVRFFP